MNLNNVQKKHAQTIQSDLKICAVLRLLMMVYPWQTAYSADGSSYPDYTEVSRIDGVYIRGFEINALVPDGGKEP